MRTVALDYALAEWLLNEYPYSFIHEALIFNKIQELYKTKHYKDQRISYIKRDTAPDAALSDKLSSLKYGGFIKPTGGMLDSSIYAISGKPDYSSEEIVCAIYPLGYLSHISAMRWHNITHKNPKTVHFTAPNRSFWKKHVFESTFGGLDTSTLETRMLIPYPSSGKHMGFELEVTQESNYIEPMKVRGSPIRVSHVAKTFLDMTRHPRISGGMDHVIDVYEEHGASFSKMIVKYVEENGTKIDKARIGFLLKEISGVNSPYISAWMNEAKTMRGGSRIFNPEVPFSPFYSPDWAISLNVEKLYKYGRKN